MKTILSILLAGAVLHASTAQAQTNVPPRDPKGGILVAVFVLGCVAAGAYIVIRVSKVLPDQDAPVTLILDRSTDGRATWEPIFTNTVILHGHEPLEFFRDRMTNEDAFYRARLMK